ncbi:T9SS type A sorting domain-containing protein [bacterium]|nr:T9SS type A sorting domain-containing protein [bacterium]
MSNLFVTGKFLMLVRKFLEKQTQLIFCFLLLLPNSFLFAETLPLKTKATKKVLVILAEFEEETTDDKSTTGKGFFFQNLKDANLDTVLKQNEIIDRPPHNQKYFQNQLLAVKNYFNSVSNGQLEMSFDVFPKNQNSYKLPQKMAFYNPATTEAALDRGLTRLVVDAFESADKDTNLVFSDYDNFVIFHAGVGKDIALGFDETPSDIPSAFLDSLFFAKNLPKTYRTEIDTIYATNPKKIIVGDGKATTGFEIKNCVILPETESQEGIQIGLTGTTTLMLAQSFGIPVLFDTDDGSTGVGTWDFMDQGSANLRGLLPANPSAWTKLWQGWSVPQEITTNRDSVLVFAKTKNQQPNLVKIPVSASEYFLIENRSRLLGTDSLTKAMDSNGNEIGIKIDKYGLLELKINPQDTLGVIVSAENYDLGIPGDGILIWHVDETLVYERLAKNTLNSSDTTRAINLMEGDGVQDIGKDYGFFSAGAGKENGTENDVWFKGNPDWIKTNKSIFSGVKDVEFKSFSLPSSKTNTGGFSHLKLGNFSEKGTVMSFDLAFESTVQGFPFEGFPFLGKLVESKFQGKETSDLLLIENYYLKNIFWNENQELAQDTSFLVFLSPEQPNKKAVLLSDELETGVLPYSQKDYKDEAIIPGETGLYVYGLASGNLLSDEKITAGPITKKGSILEKSIFVGTESGKIYGIDSRGDYDSLLVTKEQKLSEETVTFLALGTEKVFAVSKNTLFTVSQNDFTTKQELVKNLPSEVVSLAVAIFSDDKERILVLCKNELLAFGTDGKEVFTVKVPEATGFAVEDFDLDGSTEIVVTTPGKVFVFTEDGFYETNFPFTLSNDKIITSASIGNLNADEKGEILFGTSKGLLYGIDTNAKVLADFPLATSFDGVKFGEMETPLILNFIEGEETEIFVTSGLKLYGFTIPGSKFLERPLWSGEGGNKTHSGFAEKSQKPLNSGNSTGTGKLRDVFNYPNPADTETKIRYFLTENTEVKVKIFDLAGNFVREFVSEGKANQVGEILWNLDKVSSGVYYAKVEAGNESKIIKIAVVK